MMPFPLGRLLRGGLLIASLGTVACGAAASGARDGPSPEAVRAYIDAGLLAQAGLHAEAARRYDEAAAADPDTAEVWLAASRAWCQLGEWDAAAERAEKAVALAPDDVRAADALGQPIVAAGRLDVADRLYAAFTHKHPEA
ncbi:MAG: tetratricopeptide repeat protein, partial [Myxococcales bacterium]|nr:tetratricopeptide repeat protein [Myxococcales bacterium]